MLKQARIDPNGKIVDADRSIHTTKNPAHGGPDSVQWLPTPGNIGNFIVRFDYPQGSPFQPGSQDIAVPPANPHTVTQGKNTYKYKVLQIVNGVPTEKDDPDVIVD